MKINDRIYGEIAITNPILIDLIKSKPVQRLKGINQSGAPHFIQPVRDVTRYEHSIGVWYLSQKYQRSIEEQIAALLHDIPHTAFSHVIDFVVNDTKQEFHEKFAKQLILNSEIPKILQHHNIDINLVLDKSRFDILENDLPDLSVDRWDYFMRDGYAIGFLPEILIKELLSDIKIKDNTFYFTNSRLAAVFAILFMSFSRLIWLDPTANGAFFLLANAIKIALNKKIITQDDFFTDDNTLLAKLKSPNIAEINKYLNRLKPGMEFQYALKNQAEFYGPNKPRYVDPLVETQKRLKRISSLVPSLSYAFKEFAQNYQNIGVAALEE